ncbi:amino acid adenylation domain-containing protein [Butyrivibrio sp. MC2013]|uniref:amino acid adenylation domain-containing protein n=1 Tax=Butyrivibrio sp. MC2013 TaxID=1280686 RepID=UPI00047A7615|nr:amino acid adenylation domain-containing protein [Butyrivibrio sp. MC2013]
MRDTNILSWLERAADKCPDKTAFADVNAGISYGELRDKSRSLAAFLIGELGDIMRRPVAFYMEKSVEAVCGMMAAVYAGAFYSFIDVRQPEGRIGGILNVLEPAVILTTSELYDSISPIAEKAAVKVLILSDILQDDSAIVNEEALLKVRESACETDPLYVNFTSGSTGVPKGVTICHRNVLEFIPIFADRFFICDEDIIANQAPFDFDVSVKDIYSGLYKRALVQIIPRDYFSQPMKLMDYIADNKATVLIWAVSAMCFVSIMNGLDYRNPDTLRLIMFSGEVMPLKQLKVWQRYLPDATYVNLYGPTEITCNCTYYVLDKERKWEDTDLIPMGIPFANERVFLLDEEDKLVGPDRPGVNGEICVSGTSVGAGYYNDPERTGAAFVQNPLNKAYLDIIYRTGDLGRYDEDGLLYYVSRKDFQIKHLGHRIELGEIENAAMALEGVSRACCIYDSVKKKIILFYTGDTDKKQLTAGLKAILPVFMIPGSTRKLDEMPMNKNCKIDRKALQELI